MPKWLNRRLYQRNAVQIPLAYGYRNRGHCWARTYDISAGGLKMKAMEDLRPGASLELTLHFAGQARRPPFATSATVVWCRPGTGPSPTLTCGVMFSKPEPQIMRYL